MRALRKAGCAGVALAATALMLVATSGVSGAAPRASATARIADNGSSNTYGSLPPQRFPATSGGTLSIAIPPGASPTYIFPITPGANLSVYDVDQFQAYMWRPCWWSPKGDEPFIDLSQSICKAPVFSDNNKVVTINMNPGWMWSNGKPVTSTDLAFDYWMTEAAVKISPANDGDYTPGLYPDDVVSISTPSASTLIIRFNKTYNANFDWLEQLGALEPLPAAAWAETSANGPIISNFSSLKTAESIYKFLNTQSKDLKTYGSNPLWQVVDGPYKIVTYDPATGANTMTINTAYSGPVKPHITTIDDEYFTSTSSEFNQLLTGNLDVGFVDFSDLAQVGRLRSLGYNVWGAPDFGFSYVDYNFKDTTGDFNNIISQLYIRQALAHLQDEQAVIQSRGVFDGAAGPAYGPTPVIPSSPFTPSNAATDPFPFSVSTAKTLLTSHGWKVVPDGTTTCQNPGTGANQCGAGIPAGTALSWNLVYTNSPAVVGSQDEVLASNAKQLGINITLQSKEFNYIVGDLNDVSSPANDNKWAMEDFGGFTLDLYPTTNEL
ncbi:MAG TPA: ABC transporter substrate-binding protein, partial [Acidimicrobiales bacterium]|nr:ABC transporter substrate-binding protein [Acidimicrobiales bacterium]